MVGQRDMRRDGRPAELGGSPGSRSGSSGRRWPAGRAGQSRGGEDPWWLLGPSAAEPQESRAAGGEGSQTDHSSLYRDAVRGVFKGEYFKRFGAGRRSDDEDLCRYGSRESEGLWIVEDSDDEDTAPVPETRAREKASSEEPAMREEISVSPMGEISNLRRWGDLGGEDGGCCDEQAEEAVCRGRGRVSGRA